MKSFRRAIFDNLVLSRKPPVPIVQMCCAVLGSLGMTSINLRLSPDSHLYQVNGGETLELIVDDVITPHVLSSGRWQPDEINFLSAYASRQPCILVDVGANIGLVTRQLMHGNTNIKAAICFEPHPKNFSFLCRNLAHLEHCYPQKSALSTSEGELQFYEDTHNIGNYSLIPGAVSGKEHRISVVKCLKASDETVLDPLPKEFRLLPIIWKSDTQGFDEAIVTSLSDEFWGRVQAGVMEITRIERPELDRTRLGNILKQFEVRYFANAPKQNLSVEEIIHYAEGNDGTHKDLHFARTK